MENDKGLSIVRVKKRRIAYDSQKNQWIHEKKKWSSKLDVSRIWRIHNSNLSLHLWKIRLCSPASEPTPHEVFRTSSVSDSSKRRLNLNFWFSLINFLSRDWCNQGIKPKIERKLRICLTWRLQKDTKRWASL